MEMNTAAAAARRQRTMTLPDGRTIGLAALTLGDLVEIRQEALARYKRDIIETWTKNAALMPEHKRDEWLEKAFMRAEQFTLDNMPTKVATLPVFTDGKAARNQDGSLRTEEKHIDYASWWGSDTFEGKRFTAWLSMRAYKGQEHITLNEVDAMFRMVAESLHEAANTIAELTTPQLGN